MNQTILSHQNNFYLGIDLGTSFVKVALINQNQQIVSIVRQPQTQMKIISEKQNFSQQDPQLWWKNTSIAIRNILKNHNKFKIKGIGISYQMHGLILVDKQGKLLRNCIIWADGRTKQIGNKLQKLMVQKQYLNRSLNNPGNFTLSKLIWVQQNQPQLFSRAYKFMLPGDYIAFKLTGQYNISQTGLSQGVMWDFQKNKPFQELFQINKIPKQLIPKVIKSFQFQGKVTREVSEQTLIPQNTPVYYRSGDQANNSYSLGVLSPGQIAAAGGTSGTIWFVTNSCQTLQFTKINTFLHVNHQENKHSYGKLLCINGCGKVYSWIKHNFFQQKSYEQMNQIVLNYQSDGIIVIPFGNGPQRMLNNYTVNFNIKNMNLNRHTANNIIRATAQAIAFSFVYGIQILKQSQKQELKIKIIKAAWDNLFKCQIICQIIATLLNCKFEIYQTTGAVGSAIGAKQGFQMHHQNYKQRQFSQKNIKKVKQIQGQKQKESYYQQLYHKWQKQLQAQLKAAQKISKEDQNSDKS